MKTIIIKTIPHGDQRYPTVGDYKEYDDRIEIRVSEMGNERYEQLVAVHELIEKILCKRWGIREEEIDKFDIIYENRRKEGDVSEPGDAVNCPYREEHFFATNIERQLALELGINWQDYDGVVSSL